MSFVIWFDFWLLGRVLAFFGRFLAFGSIFHTVFLLFIRFLSIGSIFDRILSFGSSFGYWVDFC